MTQSLILNAHSKTPFEPKYGLELNCSSMIYSKINATLLYLL